MLERRVIWHPAKSESTNAVTAASGSSCRRKTVTRHGYLTKYLTTLFSLRMDAGFGVFILRLSCLTASPMSGRSKLRYEHLMTADLNCLMPTSSKVGSRSSASSSSNVAFVIGTSRPFARELSKPNSCFSISTWRMSGSSSTKPVRSSNLMTLLRYTISLSSRGSGPRFPVLRTSYQAFSFLSMLSIAS